MKRQLSPRMQHFLFSLVIIFILVGLCYLVCRGSGDLCHALLSKTGVSMGCRALSVFLMKMGCSASGLLLCLLISMCSVMTEPATMMMEADPGPSSSNQGGQESTSQPVADVPAAPMDPDLYVPLLEDGDRRRELTDRFRINSIGFPENPEERHQIVETHLQIEKKIEKALLSDGYSRDSLLAKRHQIRAILFYPRGSPLSKKTYGKYLFNMNNYGTHRTLPYKRILDALARLDLILIRERPIKKRN